jgi:hypothetical protein
MSQHGWFRFEFASPDHDKHLAGWALVWGRQAQAHAASAWGVHARLPSAGLDPGRLGLAVRHRHPSRESRGWGQTDSDLDPSHLDSQGLPTQRFLTGAHKHTLCDFQGGSHTRRFGRRTAQHRFASLVSESAKQLPSPTQSLRVYFPPSVLNLSSTT